ncbi:TPA: phage tail protein [Vibrio vulnificus]
MAGLKLQFTEAGLAKLLSEKDKGLKGEITHMAFGDGDYTPSKTQTALLREKERIEVADYQGDGKNLRMAGVFEGNLEYAIREIGIFLSDGTLLGVYSQQGKTLGYRTPVVRVVQWFTLNIEALPTDSVTVVVGSENLNLVIDEEFAQMATVQINTMHRQLQQEFRILDLEKKVG